MFQKALGVTLSQLSIAVDLSYRDMVLMGCSFSLAALIV